MTARASELAVQVGPWLLLALVLRLTAVIWLTRMVLRGQKDLPTKDVHVQIGPLRIICMSSTVQEQSKVSDRESKADNERRSTTDGDVSKEAGL